MGMYVNEQGKDSLKVIVQINRLGHKRNGVVSQTRINKLLIVVRHVDLGGVVIIGAIVLPRDGLKVRGFLLVQRRLLMTDS